MQETLHHADGTTFEVTFCDSCNTDQNRENTIILPDDWAAALGVRPKTLALSGTYEGVTDDALDNGWEERDFGFVCPACAYEEARLAEQGDSQAFGPEDALSLLTEGAKTG